MVQLCDTCDMCTVESDVMPILVVPGTLGQMLSDSLAEPSSLCLTYLYLALSAMSCPTTLLQASVACFTTTLLGLLPLAENVSCWFLRIRIFSMQINRVCKWGKRWWLWWWVCVACVVTGGECGTGPRYWPGHLVTTGQCPQCAQWFYTQLRCGMGPSQDHLSLCFQITTTNMQWAGN